MSRCFVDHVRDDPPQIDRAQLRRSHLLDGPQIEFFDYTSRQCALVFIRVQEDRERFRRELPPASLVTGEIASRCCRVTGREPASFGPPQMGHQGRDAHSGRRCEQRSVGVPLRETLHLAAHRSPLPIEPPSQNRPLTTETLGKHSIHTSSIHAKRGSRKRADLPRRGKRNRRVPGGPSWVKLLVSGRRHRVRPIQQPRRRLRPPRHRHRLHRRHRPGHRRPVRDRWLS
jgi:hypothetical protein